MYLERALKEEHRSAGLGRQCGHEWDAGMNQSGCKTGRTSTLAYFHDLQTTKSQLCVSAGGWRS